ncbi:MAG: bacteriohemerythrin [Planctomycetota bacterium]|nr:bacteriohemerythrin [Planctomycetota bacterium]MCX8040265.1 bacteriohemerythrin [Planctomycetota bacterium]MDW8372440.1 bacteriohemerythrin [Planctomycetota bacterium]
MSAWTADLATGHPELDRDHRELMELIEQLREAAAAGDAKARLSHALDRFREHVQRHFPEEERDMEAAAYPALARHREAHRALTAMVSELAVKDAGGDTVLYSEVEQLAQALQRHIVLDDRAYAAHRRGR